MQSEIKLKKMLATWYELLRVFKYLTGQLKNPKIFEYPLEW